MTYDNLLRQRLTHLLTRKGVTEYKMSLDLGRSKNYIRDILLNALYQACHNSFIYVNI